MISQLVKGNDQVVAVEQQGRKRDGTVPPRRPRVAAAVRERMIVAEAIKFFADEGFDGQIRALAERIGITHSILFRHFPSKEALIERVYQDVYVRRMRPEWTALLRDRSLPLEARLFAFYREYTDAIFHHDWIRIFMFAGLKGVHINAPYLALLRETVLFPICAELRTASTGAEPDAPFSDEEIERAWGLHGRIFYLAIRKFVYGTQIPVNLDQTLKDAIAIFLGGVTAQPEIDHTTVPEENCAAAETIAEKTATSMTKRRRMPPEERERLILDGAVAFFAEHGMDGQMRELAKRLGVTHPLLYRYFPVKEALIERVYEEVYVNRWKVEWEALLHDGAQPLQTRLTAFYLQYAEVIDHPEWIRIFVFAGLRGVDICTRYLDLVKQRIIVPVARALRLRRGADAHIDERDLEIAWGLHGQIVYLSIRRWVYGIHGRGSRSPLVAAAVASVVAGVDAAGRSPRPNL
jgi:AcrR family transcriptional regulator